jgi:imidazolonepropionase-like amidohydrolase
MPALSEALVITHVTVVDGRSSEGLTDRSVIVRGRHIAAEGAASNTAIPRSARVIDGRGKYLIPGLWDMHVHTVVPGGRDVLALYIANGVTGVRDMAGDWQQLQAWRREIAAGALVGPRIVASGPYLEGGDVPIPHLLVRRPEDAQRAVDSLVRLGVDFVKVHSQLTRETYFAIARAARARGISFVGHVPRTVGARDASDSGQRSIEHLLTIPNRCTSEEAKALEPRYPVQSVFGKCTTESLEPLFAAFVRNDTWMVPTLVAQREVALWPTTAVPGDSLARYLPDTLRRYVAAIFPMPPDVPVGADSVGRALFDKRVAIVGEMYRAGVHVLPGTDAPLRNSPPGFGLHEELAYLARAGLSPFEVLRATTLEPAQFFHATDSLGTIEAGKLADLVLLDANPLEGVANLRRISATIANGRYYGVRRDASGHHLIP